MKAPAKVLNDNLHGRVELSGLEADIISTKVFLRLGHLTQLGLAKLVFPSATHTRFSHALGVMHLAGRVADTLGLGDEDVQKIRVAALLHDIGQYPLSHCIEHVYRRIANRQANEELFVNPQQLEQTSPLLEAGTGSTSKGRSADDKRMGGFIIGTSSELRAVFEKHGLASWIDEIARIVEGNPKDSLYQAILNSDYDCDRLDYVQRDGLMTGVPYGRIDLDYLIENMAIRHFPPNSRERILAVNRRKGIGALEHYLLARYFVYAQVSFHKTVRSLELLAKAVFLQLAREGRVFRNHQEIRSVVNESRFLEFNDSYFFRAITTYHKSRRASQSTKNQIERLLSRKPLKLSFEVREFGVEEKSTSEFRVAKTMLTNPSVLSTIAEQSGIAVEEIVVDLVPHIELVPFRTEANVSHAELVRFVTEIQQGQVPTLKPTISAPWLYDGDKLTLLAEDNGSLLHMLRDQKLFTIRVYTFDSQKSHDLRRAIEKQLSVDVG